MNIEIRLNDGTVLNASFDPIHKDDLITYYANQYNSRQIAGYVMRDNSGSVVKVGIQWWFFIMDSTCCLT
jgi:hypothetical protein